MAKKSMPFVQVKNSGKGGGLIKVLMVVLLVAAVVLAIGAIDDKYNNSRITSSLIQEAEMDGSGEFSGDGPWSGREVPIDLSVKDKYTGSDVGGTVKLYSLDKKPADWGNPREDFDDSENYDTYTLGSDGTVQIDDQMPGQYVAIITNSSYNTMFVEGIVIPDGPEQTGSIVTESLSDYSAAPNSLTVRATQIPTVTGANATATLANDSSFEEEYDIDLEVAENTEFKGWRAVIKDLEGFHDDADNDDVSDEGIQKLVVKIGNVEATIVDFSNGVVNIDDNDEYEMDLTGLSVADGEDIEVVVEIEGETGDYTGANDEVWGEGEGNLLSIAIRDLEGTSVATSYVIS